MIPPNAAIAIKIGKVIDPKITEGIKPTTIIIIAAIGDQTATSPTSNAIIKLINNPIALFKPVLISFWR